MTDKHRQTDSKLETMGKYRYLTPLSFVSLVRCTDTQLKTVNHSFRKLQGLAPATKPQMNQ